LHLQIALFAPVGGSFAVLRAEWVAFGPVREASEHGSPPEVVRLDALERVQPDDLLRAWTVDRS